MKGKITKLNAWKSGKGFFVGIDGNDHMFYGSTKVKVGEEVEYELGKPTNDGTPKIAKLYSTSLEAFVDEDKPNSATVAPYRAHDQAQGTREDYWKAKEQRDKEREPIMLRTSCLVSASNVFSGAQKEEGIIELAKRFEKYIKEGV
jgi:hypothetical protein